METNTHCINAQLLNLQDEWIKECNAEKMSKEFRLSRPFSYAVTSEYINTGINLDAIPLGKYVILLKETTKNDKCYD